MFSNPTVSDDKPPSPFRQGTVWVKFGVEAVSVKEGRSLVTVTGSVIEPGSV